MIDFCGYKFQVGVQTIHLYPIGADLWQMHAVTVCHDLGQVLPGDFRLTSITLDSDPNSLDPDQIAPGVKCFVREARDLHAVIQATTDDFKKFAKQFSGVAFRSLANNGSWIIKGVARSMSNKFV